jgi:serine/threonine protein kinase
LTDLSFPLASTSTEETSSKNKLPVTQRYTIGKELGSGAFSVVYDATENVTNEHFAIKILDRYEDDDEQAAKFKHEIDMISSLKHDNIVQFVELDQDDEHYYVVMELVKVLSSVSCSP